TGEPFRVEMHESFAILGLRPNEYDVVNVKYDPESHETIFDFTGDPRFDLEAMRARTTQMRKETAEMNAARAAGGGQPMFQFLQGAAPPAARSSDPVADIERLVALRDSGALTPAEFDAMKAKLIGPT
ncbi:MAG: Short C-terminal protein, partial [Ilumatobacteraceae bacterium]|nr:Short C-terminal protein [Ilumatobacteraceae bacterium]